MVLSLARNRPIAAMGERAVPGRPAGTAEGANAREPLRLNTIDGGPLWRVSGPGARRGTDHRRGTRGTRASASTFP
jgi:hypothetical protein